MSTDKAAPALTDTEALIIVRDAGLLEPMTAPQIARVHALVSAGYRAGCAARPASAENTEGDLPRASGQYSHGRTLSAAGVAKPADVGSQEGVTARRDEQSSLVAAAPVAWELWRAAKGFMQHKSSCPPAASNFQKNKPCKCGKDAALIAMEAAMLGQRASPPAAEPPMSPAVLRAMDRFWSKADAVDAARYRFLRSPLAAQGGPVQVELWAEMGVKLCREEAMDREVDAAMRLLGVESPADASAAEAKEPK